MSSTTAASKKASIPLLLPDALAAIPAWQLKTQRYAPVTIPMEYPAMALPTRAPISSLFRGAFQNGFLSIFYSVGANPLEMWEKQLRTGSLKRILDYEIRSQTIELISNNIVSTFITTPPGPFQSLGVRLPIVVLVVKNLKRYFLFEVQILDDTSTRRRFKVSNYHTGVKVKPFLVMVPMKLEDGWNQISLNLQDMAKKSFGTNFVEVIRVQVHANCRLRRIYFCEKAFGEDEIPADMKNFVKRSSQEQSPEPGSSRRKLSDYTQLR